MRNTDPSPERKRWVPSQELTQDVWHRLSVCVSHRLIAGATLGFDCSGIASSVIAPPIPRKRLGLE